MAQLANIQILRACAALMVLVSHLGTEIVAIAARRGTELTFDPAPWTSGVDLFFVVSGFIMVVTAGGQFGRPGAPARFMLRRLVRVVPLYWLLTTVTLAGGLVLPSLLNVPVNDLGHVVASYLFWPWPRATGEMRPVMALGWTLNFEMAFYVLFALALALPRRLGLAALAAVLLGMVALGQAVALPGALGFWASPVLLEFLAGVLVGLAFLRGWRVGDAVAGIAVAGGLAALALSGAAAEHRGSLAAIAVLAVPATVVVAAAAMGPQGPAGPFGRMLVVVGDASYSLYLVHPFVLRPLRNVWMAMPGLPLWLYAVAGVAAAVVVALALYRLFERPATAALQRRLADAPAASRPLQPAS